MLELKAILNTDMEAICELFAGLYDDAMLMEDEPVEISTEEETYVIMTADDFQLLKESHTTTMRFNLSCDMMDELESLSVMELETILTLVSSQLNIKLAKQYVRR